MEIKPLLSIITVSAFDHERLSQTMISLRNSTTEIEHLIVIPKNDLISLEVIKAFSLDSSTRIQVLHDENTGIYPAMNIGGENASGKYLCFWNAGDSLFSQANLQGLIEILDTNRPSWLIFQGIFNWHSPQILTREAVRDFVLHKNRAFFSHQTVAVAKDLFLKIDGFKTNYRVAADASQITLLFEKFDPFFLDLPIVNVEAPVFAAKHNRRGRFENLQIALFEMNGSKRVCTLWNILKGELTQLFARFRA
jgi:glycosyltransferase involved in cell wall biosynthesis